MDRLTSLMVFAKVAENGGFSAAARRLGISVTTASNHVQALEDQLGARLLNRTTRRVSLTEIGSAYYDRCRQILADLEEADRLAMAEHATPRGALRVYTGPNVARFLTPAIAEFIALYPAVSIDLTIGEQMVDLVENGYDLAIRSRPLADSQLVVRNLTPWYHVPVCAPSYLQHNPTPQDPTDLAFHNCLRFAFYPFGQEWRLVDESGAPLSVRVQGNIVTSSAEMLRRLAIEGQGIFLAPTFMVADDLAQGSLVRILPTCRGVEFMISAIYPHRHNLSTKVRRFIDLLAERFTQHRIWMNPGMAAS